MFNPFVVLMYKYHWITVRLKSWLFKIVLQINVLCNSVHVLQRAQLISARTSLFHFGWQPLYLYMVKYLKLHGSEMKADLFVVHLLSVCYINETQ